MPEPFARRTAPSVSGLLPLARKARKPSTPGRESIRSLRIGPAGYGLLAAAIPVGGVLGGLLTERVASLLGAGTTLLAGLAVEVATHLVLASTQSACAVGAVLVLFSFPAVVWGAVSASLRQEIVPERLMGRVNRVYLLFDAGSGSAGALLGGFLAAGFGLTAPFWAAAACVAAWIAVVRRRLGDRAAAAARRSANEP